ncbi:MAG: DUF3025 domain-containing protein [Myxococcales bacterium]|nr:DUF3025 domain-containing protein [Myxococcales bacterium]
MHAWDPARWRGPRFAAYRATIASLPTGPRWPTVAELDAHLGAGLRRARTLRLVAQAPRGATDALPYELAIADRGWVPTRARNAHDLWNAVVWATFPRGKWALTERLAGFQRARYAAGPRLPGARAPAHDRLALLDEGGLIVVGARALVFGHAILEHAARAELAVRAAPLALPPSTPWQADAIDAALAIALADGAEVAPGPGIEIDDATLAPLDDRGPAGSSPNLPSSGASADRAPTEDAERPAR